MNNVDRLAQHYQEPYIGMPIYLDRCDDNYCIYNNNGNGNVGDNQDNNMNGNQDNDMIGNSGNIIGDCLSQMPLAMTYVPMQKWETPYEPEVALENGTMFPSLNLPFLGGAVR